MRRYQYKRYRWLPGYWCSKLLGDAWDNWITLPYWNYRRKKGFEGDDCNEIYEAVTPYLRALDGINVMDSAFHTALASGITGVMVGPGSSNVVGGQFIFIKTHGRAIDDMVVLQPAAMKVAFGENIKTNYDQKNKIPSTRMSIAALLREELFKAKQYNEKKKML